ncbi:efflux RND transporter periplasmic adaptor subunit ['Paenibacillus yunnanensis' Narsing Rao et al. 2020]|uniref:efflux RND transporter periplasmic adaptor subunit n=1 Tax=Paenibacillus tengchongensis TaxID=2608684 RepID=UPI00165262B0|nr:efflux RND transporter periplasmic adaptor subunit [Paenibacillus tengchongensis]
MNKKKVIWTSSIVVVAAVAGILTYVLWPDQNNTAGAVQLNTARVTRGNILVGVSGSGSVSAINSESVRTKEAGEVDQVMVKKGDVVKAGDVLITFTPNDMSDQMKQAEKSLESLKTELADKQESYKTLAMNNASEEELKNAKQAIEKAQSDIADQEESIADLEEDMLPPDPLTAPIGGTITAVNITDGEQAQNGAELFTMTDYENLSVTVQVDELDIPSVELGQAATITLDALEDQEFSGKVIEIAKEGSSSNGVSLFDVTVGLDESDGVLVGMSAEVAITIEEKKDVLTVPIEAVSEVNGKYYVNVPASAEGSADKAAAGDAAGRGQAPEGAAPAGDAGQGEAPASGDTAQGGAPAQGDMPEGGFPGGGDMPGGDFPAGGDMPSGDMPSGFTGGGYGGEGGYGGGRGTRAAGGRSGGSGTSTATSQTRVAVEVGIHDESTIEIVSGLSEGDEVVIPTVISTNSSSSQAVQGQMGGMGGMGGGFTGGGITGGGAGGGFSGGGGMPGGGGGRP